MSIGHLSLDAQALYGQMLKDLQERVSPEAHLVGITSGGAWLAERLHADLGRNLGVVDREPVVDVPAVAATSELAMAQLLQPLATPAQRAPRRAARSDDPAPSFTGDANLANAGLVLLWPLVHRAGGKPAAT